jgi:arginine N-succinyltransferase
MNAGAESFVGKSLRQSAGRDALVVRPAKLADLEGLYSLALVAGSGMTNLPSDREFLRTRLAQSEGALHSEESRSRGDPILFVVEHSAAKLGDESGPIVGTACIFAKIGVDWPFYSYRLTRQSQTSKALGKAVSHDVLILANDFDGATEVGGLFVDPSVRGLSAGKLAARSRYLFLVEHRSWFPHRVISELRGYQDETGVSPVWEGLGREFYDMDFAAADRTNATAGNQFIADLAPRHPIYTSLLPKAARDALGRPHDDGRRARDMLLGEGFRFDGHVDIFDGGPTLSAAIDDLRGVRESRISQVEQISPVTGVADELVSVGVGADFRAARGALISKPEGGIVADEGLARALRLTAGDLVRHVAF